MNRGFVPYVASVLGCEETKVWRNQNIDTEISTVSTVGCKNKEKPQKIEIHVAKYKDKWERMI